MRTGFPRHSPFHTRPPWNATHPRSQDEVWSGNKKNNGRNCDWLGLFATKLSCWAVIGFELIGKWQWVVASLGSNGQADLRHTRFLSTENGDEGMRVRRIEKKNQEDPKSKDSWSSLKKKNDLLRILCERRTRERNGRLNETSRRSWSFPTFKNNSSIHTRRIMLLKNPNGRRRSGGGDGGGSVRKKHFLTFGNHRHLNPLFAFHIFFFFLLVLLNFSLKMCQGTEMELGSSSSAKNVSGDPELLVFRSLKTLISSH